MDGGNFRSLLLSILTLDWRSKGQDFPFLFFFYDRLNSSVGVSAVRMGVGK